MAKKKYIGSPDSDRYIDHANLNVSRALGLPVFADAPTINNNPESGSYIGVKDGVLKLYFNGEWISVGTDDSNTLQLGQFIASSNGLVLEYSWAHGLDLTGVNLATDVSISVEGKGDAVGNFTWAVDATKIYVTYKIGRKVGTNNLAWVWMIAKRGASPSIPGGGGGGVQYLPDFDPYPKASSQKLLNSGSLFTEFAKYVKAVTGSRLITTEEIQLLANIEPPHDKGSHPTLAALRAAFATGAAGDFARVAGFYYNWSVADGDWLIGTALPGGGGAGDFVGITGTPQSNALLAAELDKINPKPSTGSIRFDRTRLYGDPTPVTGNITEEISEDFPAYPGIGGLIVHLNTGGTIPVFPVRWVIKGAYVPFSKNKIAYTNFTDSCDATIYQ